MLILRSGTRQGVMHKGASLQYYFKKLKLPSTKIPKAGERMNHSAQQPCSPGHAAEARQSTARAAAGHHFVGRWLGPAMKRSSWRGQVGDLLTCS